MSLTTVQPGMLGTPQPYSFKNRIINGAMVMAQRGTSFSFGSAGGTPYYAADRFLSQDYTWSAGSNITISNDTTIFPTGFTNSYKWANGATPLTFNSGGYQWISQAIEGYNVADLYSSNVTLSFWARSSTAGTYSVSFTNGRGSYERFLTKNYTINSANTWEYKTITIDLSAGISSGTWNKTNGEGLSISWILGAHANRTSNVGLDSWANGSGGTIGFNSNSSVNLATIANQTFYLTGVQLESGTTATNFDFRSYGTELALCQRYYQKTYNIGTKPGATGGYAGGIYSGAIFCYKGNTAGANEAGATWQYKTSMRTNPTITFYSPANGTAGYFTAGSTDNLAGINAPIIGENNSLAYGSASAGGSSNDCYFHMTASAEL
jgi:hypothetical protein